MGPILSSEQIHNIAVDLLSMSRDDAFMRIGGMQVSEPDRKRIIAEYEELSPPDALPLLTDHEINEIVGELMQLYPEKALATIKALNIFEVDRNRISTAYKAAAASLPPPIPSAAYVGSPPVVNSAHSSGNIIYSKQKKRPVARWLIVLVVLFGIIAAFAILSSSQTSNPPANDAASAPSPSFDVPEASPRPNFSTTESESGRFLAPLDITVPDGDNYYYIVLISKHDNSVGMTIFMHPGSQHEFLAPIGTYDIYVASGEKWYGYKHLFGPDGSYSKLDSTFRFSEDSEGYNGHALELEEQVGGNLESTDLNYGTFFGYTE